MKEVYFDRKGCARSIMELGQVSWRLIEDGAIDFKRWLAEHVVEQKFSEWIGAGRYERTGEKRPWRNGHYRRTIQLRSCRLKDIRIPRAIGLRWVNPLFERFQRKAGEFEEMVYDCFVLGMSGRGIREHLHKMFGEDILSAQGVSDIYRKFTRAVKGWHTRKIPGRYKYIYWDGKWVRIRGARKRKKVILKVMGITETGECEIIDFRVARSESYLEWSGLAQSLYERGLHGEGTELFIHDGAGGLVETLTLIWPDIARQQCKVHHLRNLSKRVKRSVRRPLLREASRIYTAASLEQAEARARRFEHRWGVCEPHALRVFMKGLDQTLTFYRFGWEKHVTKEQRHALWKSISNTNILERNIEEDVRRIISMRSFRNDDSCDRTFYALARRFNENPWRLPGYIPNQKSAEILT